VYAADSAQRLQGIHNPDRAGRRQGKNRAPDSNRIHFLEQAMTFADNLKQLPAVTHLAALQLLNAAGDVVATLENKPGQSGALAVYAALAARHGSINVAAAQEGLDLFAEHTAHARAHPGSHPNIDRLLAIITSGQGYAVQLLQA
jgi:hypothetical protein